MSKRSLRHGEPAAITYPNNIWGAVADVRLKAVVIDTTEGNALKKSIGIGQLIYVSDLTLITGLNYDDVVIDGSNVVIDDGEAVIDTGV